MRRKAMKEEQKIVEVDREAQINEKFALEPGDRIEIINERGIADYSLTKGIMNLLNNGVGSEEIVDYKGRAITLYWESPVSMEISEHGQRVASSNIAAGIAEKIETLLDFRR